MQAFFLFFFYGYYPGKLFRKFLKIPKKIMLQTLYLKLYENTILTSMFSYEFFRTTFPLKTFQLPLNGVLIIL